MVLPAALAACGGDCASLSGEEQANCAFEAIAQQVEAGRLDEAEAGIAALPDQLAREFVRLRLAIRHPEQAARWCAAVTEEPARGQCDKLLGRPHLRRAP